MIKKHSKGFTLVELLVVISIIALLLSILMPSLQKARESARRVVCATNLHQWSLAVTAYVSDNKGKIPLTWGAASTEPWPLNIAEAAVAPGEISINGIAPYISGIDVKNKKLPKSIWFCPNWDIKLRKQCETMWKQNGYFNLSYSYFAGSSKMWANRQGPRMQEKIVQDLTGTNLSSSKLLMGDALVWFGISSGYGWVYNHGTNGPSTTTDFWSSIHDKGPPKLTGTNNLYGDGSVRWKGRGEFDLNAMQQKLNWPFLNSGVTY